jgi:N-acetylglucosamine-6-phosphate deacetylase
VRELAAVGATTAEAVHAATVAPARLLGRPGLGTLTPGGRADITVLDDRLHVVRTVVGGVEAFAR